MIAYSKAYCAEIYEVEKAIDSWLQYSVNTSSEINTKIFPDDESEREGHWYMTIRMTKSDVEIFNAVLQEMDPDFMVLFPDDAEVLTVFITQELATTIAWCAMEIQDAKGRTMLCNEELYFFARRTENRDITFPRADMDSIGPLYHVGTMNWSEKSEFSLEGDTLSASPCPEAWTKIARLGGRPTFKLYKPDMQLLDYHKMTEEQRGIIADWAVSAGYATRGFAYETVVSYTEDDEECRSVFTTLEEAKDETIEEEDQIKEIPWLFPTEKFKDLSYTNIEVLNIRERLAILYAEMVLHFDGVYFDDELDVYAFSAPRAAIFNSALPSITVTEIKKN